MRCKNLEFYGDQLITSSTLLITPLRTLLKTFLTTLLSTSHPKLPSVSRILHKLCSLMYSRTICLSVSCVRVLLYIGAELLYIECFELNICGFWNEGGLSDYSGLWPLSPAIFFCNALQILRQRSIACCSAILASYSWQVTFTMSKNACALRGVRVDLQLRRRVWSSFIQYPARLCIFCLQSLSRKDQSLRQASLAIEPETDLKRLSSIWYPRQQFLRFYYFRQLIPQPLQTNARAAITLYCMPTSFQPSKQPSISSSFLHDNTLLPPYEQTLIQASSIYCSKSKSNCGTFCK